MNRLTGEQLARSEIAACEIPENCTACGAENGVGSRICHACKAARRLVSLPGHIHIAFLLTAPFWLIGPLLIAQAVRMGVFATSGVDILHTIGLATMMRTASLPGDPWSMAFGFALFGGLFTWWFGKLVKRRFREIMNPQVFWDSV